VAFKEMLMLMSG